MTFSLTGLFLLVDRIAPSGQPFALLPNALWLPAGVLVMWLVLIAVASAVALAGGGRRRRDARKVLRLLLARGWRGRPR